MRFRRSIILPAVLALSAAGSVLGTTVVSLAATAAPAVVAAAPAHAAHPRVVYDG